MTPPSRKRGTRRPSRSKARNAGASTARKSAKRPRAKSVADSPTIDVARVAKGVADQAKHALSEGVGALREFGEKIVDRAMG